MVVLGEYQGFFFFFQAEDGIRDHCVTGVQTCALPILAAARRFCEVVGIDYVPMLLDEGRQRAEADGLAIDFRECDAEAIPFADASFDVVLSTIGVIFAPDQEKAANELMRVCKPGGRIGMA